MPPLCGTYNGYQSAARYKRRGQPNCGPCEKCLEAARSYYKQPKFKERRSQYALERRKTDLEFRLNEHDQHQRLAYGIVLAQKELIFAEQGSCCAVCRRLSSSSTHGWFTDHNHSTGDVRGVVCVNCNSLIGHACKAAGSEDPANLSEYLGERVLDYLRTGAARVRQILGSSSLTSKPRGVPRNPVKLTTRQFEVLCWLDDSAFKRPVAYSGMQCIDMLLRLVSRGFAEWKLRDGMARARVYRRTPAGLLAIRTIGAAGEQYVKAEAI